MDKKFCDRCNAEITGVIPSWVKYYDDRLEKTSHWDRSWEYGHFRQEICPGCLNELKVVLDAPPKSAPTEQPKPVTPACSDCWWCRLKRRFGGKK